MFVVKRILGQLLVGLFLLVAGQSVAVAAPVLLFDQGHDQRFVVEKDGPLHLSQFAALLKEDGFDVKVNTSPFSADSLTGVDALVISGPFGMLKPEETEAVMAFLARGGKLALMLHIPGSVADLIHRLDVDFTNYVLSEQENVIGGDPRNFQVKNIITHPLFGSLDHFSIYGGWALMNTGNGARIIASTSDKGWVDLDGDKKLTKWDAVQSFGVVVEGTRGAGRFLIFGDDAIFQNKFLDEQNRQLARNLAKWLK
ncbi:MAG TPA: DUF4350 domain-containing protein [Geobacteraceae bacterium]|nr:DUF4350 domain-containing protein [Geobacteraceae bacterium]